MPDPRATEEKAFAAEQGLAGLRLAIILLNSVVYLFLLDKEGTYPTLAYAIIALANLYGLGVVATRPYRRFPVMLSSYFTTALDAVFITLWLVATGGFASPFYPLWLVSVTAVAFRYGYLETLFAALVYALCDVTLVAAMGQLEGNLGPVLVRSAYILFVAAAGALFARESIRQHEEKLEARRLADALRESEDRFRRLSEAAFEGIAIHENGRILEVNASLARLLGYDPSEMVGMTAYDLIAAEDHAMIADRLRRRQDTPYEARARRKDGTLLDVEITARDFPYRGQEARVVAIRDVTERKRAERAVHEKAALQATNDRLRELDAMKTQFINNAAHELGTPLTPIKLQTHLLRTDGTLTDRQRRSLDVLSRNVEHLSLMVRDLLDASRLTAGRLQLARRPVDVARLVAEAAESYGEAARQAGIRLDVRAEGPLVAEADGTRVMQVLLNFLSNAIKFTPAGGAIAMEAERAGGEIVVRVRDTGPGLGPDQLARLFQPFSQVHGTRGPAGTGLGLYVSRGIVEQHGGRIWAQSEGDGRGSVFAFAIPAKRPALPPSAEAA